MTATLHPALGDVGGGGGDVDCCYHTHAHKRRHIGTTGNISESTPLLHACTLSAHSTNSPGQGGTAPDRSRAGLCVQSLTATVWWTSGSDGSPFKLGRSGEGVWSLETEATSCVGASRSVDAAFCTVP